MSKRLDQGFRRSVHATLKLLHPTLKISRQSKDTLQQMLQDVLDRIIHEAVGCRLHKRVLPRDIQTAVSLVLPPTMAKQASSAAIGALARHDSVGGGGRVTGGSGGGGSGESITTRHSKRAGLLVSVSKVRSNVVAHHNMLISVQAAIVVAATLEYILAEILSGSGLWVQKDRRVVLTTRDIGKTLKRYSDIRALFGPAVVVHHAK